MIRHSTFLVLAVAVALPLPASAQSSGLGQVVAYPAEYEREQEQSQWCWAATAQFTNAVMKLDGGQGIEQCQLANLRAEWCAQPDVDCSVGPEPYIQHTANCCEDASAAADTSGCNQTHYTPWMFATWGNFGLTSTRIAGEEVTWQDIKDSISANPDAPKIINAGIRWESGGGHLVSITGYLEETVPTSASGRWVKVFNPARGGSQQWIQWEEFLGNDLGKKGAKKPVYAPHSIGGFYVDIRKT